MARDQVKLTHVETHRQEAHLENAPESQLKAQLTSALERAEVTAPLSNDELNVISAIGKRRLFLQRIMIIMNQTRVPLGLAPLREDDLLEVLKSLEKTRMLITELVHSEGQERLVFYLTEEGQEHLI